MAVFERQCLSTRFEFDIEGFRAGYENVYDPDSPLIRFYVLTILLFERLFYEFVRDTRGKRYIDTVKLMLARF